MPGPTWKKILLDGDAASVFTQLTDCPAAYTSAGLDLVRVNVGATGLEFVSATPYTDTNKVMVSAVDTTPEYLNQKLLVDANFFELTDSGAGNETLTLTLDIDAHVDFAGFQGQNFVLHTVADAAALAALTAVVGKIAWRTDTLHPYVCTSL